MLLHSLSCQAGHLASCWNPRLLPAVSRFIASICWAGVCRWELDLGLGMLEMPVWVWFCLHLLKKSFSFSAICAVFPRWSNRSPCQARSSPDDVGSSGGCEHSRRCWSPPKWWPINVKPQGGSRGLSIPLLVSHLIPEDPWKTWWGFVAASHRYSYPKTVWKAPTAKLVGWGAVFSTRCSCRSSSWSMLTSWERLLGSNKQEHS